MYKYFLSARFHILSLSHSESMTQSCNAALSVHDCPAVRKTARENLLTPLHVATSIAVLSRVEARIYQFGIIATDEGRKLTWKHIDSSERLQY